MWQRAGAAAGVAALGAAPSASGNRQRKKEIPPKPHYSDPPQCSRRDTPTGKWPDQGQGDGQGRRGQRFIKLRIYDATDVDIENQPPHAVVDLRWG